MGKKIKLGSGLGVPGSTREEVGNLKYSSQGSPTEHVALFKQRLEGGKETSQVDIWKEEMPGSGA